MKKLLIAMIILITSLVVYWILGAYFTWDINWLANTMPYVDEIDRMGLFLGFMMVTFVTSIPFCPYFD